MNSKWDVVVIGGGPAGMMAAGRAAELGAKVILIEKNENLGKKLLITGGGRCNLTNAEIDVRKFLGKFKDSNKFLFSTFIQFGVQETLKFFNTRNLKTKTEPGQRVFPISDKSQSVLNVLVDYMKNGNVVIKSNTQVVGIIKNGNKIESIKLKSGEVIKSKKFF